MAASAAHGASSDPSAVPLATRLEEANTLKALGNDQYGKKNYAVAITHYTDAIARLPPRPDDVPDDAPEEEPEEEPDAPQEISAAASEPQDASVPAQSVTLEEHLVFEEIGALRVKLYANLAACHLKLVRTFVLTQDQLDETIRASTEGRWPADAVLCEEPKNVKALHRRAVAHEKLGGWAHLNDALQGTLCTLTGKTTNGSMRLTKRGMSRHRLVRSYERRLPVCVGW